MNHPNDRSLAEQAKALLIDDSIGSHLEDPGFKTMQADTLAKLEIARQIGRVADALERMHINVNWH